MQLLSCRSIPAATEEVASVEAAEEAEVPPMDQTAPAEEILPAPSPLLVVLEQLPGGSPDPPRFSEPPPEGTSGGPSSAEGAPEDTTGVTSGPSSPRPAGVLVVTRASPDEVPEASALVGLSADEGEFNDEPEDDDEMAAFKELVAVSPDYLFTLNLWACIL